MLAKAKESWRELKRGKPGKRFQDRHRRKNAEGRHPVRKPLMIGVGLVVLAAGLFFLPAPGPGIIIVALGAGLLAQESLIAAKALDWSELRIRAVIGWALGVWKRSGTPARAAIVLVGIVLAAAGAWAGWKVTFG